MIVPVDLIVAVVMISARPAVSVPPGLKSPLNRQRRQRPPTWQRQKQIRLPSLDIGPDRDRPRPRPDRPGRSRTSRRICVLSLQAPWRSPLISYPTSPPTCPVPPNITILRSLEDLCSSSVSLSMSPARRPNGRYHPQPLSAPVLCAARRPRAGVAFTRGAQVALHKGPASLPQVVSRGEKTWSFNNHDCMQMPCHQPLKLVLTHSNPPHRLEPRPPAAAAAHSTMLTQIDYYP
ncbi:hypothetical protein K458DRAFT_114416 [Lentithecium fluviatile CBS 122367]|uniref:Uncharacterized protein n=1 Tax=Lentithecium fluviatile CBS 122367 TaxID=1168545 RepID=A0A6G1INZ5_9PLEO|nr:hypothetical protein K458DRAFT_114416 [Lentithecium fluviatile CBS 122367]